MNPVFKASRIVKCIRDGNGPRACKLNLKFMGVKKMCSMYIPNIFLFYDVELVKGGICLLPYF